MYSCSITMFLFSQVLLLLLLLLLLIVAQTAKAKKKPNIVFIIADDLGYNDVSYHGSEIHTPNIDRLALGGIRLENFYTQPTCSPSRGELLTGRYGVNTGFYGMPSQMSKHGLPLTEVTLPQILARQGYINYHIGKWHLGYFNASYLPTHRGYHSFFGFHTGRINYYNKRRCATLVKRSVTARLCGYDLWVNETVYMGRDRFMYSTNLFTKRAVNVIKTHNKSKPLFLMLAHQAGHTPLQTTKKCLDRNKHINNHIRRVYASMVTCLDDSVGAVRDALIESKMWNNTVIIFISDNGAIPMYGGNNWPLRGEKGSVFEGGLRVPAFISGPLVPLGALINTDVLHITDWLPTIVSLAGGTIPSNIDGFNIWPSISQQETSPRTETLLHMNVREKKSAHSLSNIFNTRLTAAIRIGDWKLITGYPGRGKWVAPPDSNHESTIFKHDGIFIRLYNIRDDPLEKHNLILSYPRQVKKMLKKLQEYFLKSKPRAKVIESMIADPSRHGGVWGPWNIVVPKVTTNQYAKLQHTNEKKTPKTKAKLKQTLWQKMSKWFSSITL